LCTYAAPHIWHISLRSVEWIWEWFFNPDSKRKPLGQISQKNLNFFSWTFWLWYLSWALEGRSMSHSSHFMGCTPSSWKCSFCLWPVRYVGEVKVLPVNQRFRFCVFYHEHLTFKRIFDSIYSLQISHMYIFCFVC